ncbi:MAG: hypothetical protein G01um101416_712 [Microgenomates group bacterium Gr01-1014_16]|nr:MAG: hypothetical protein G01um101416_712 [Microgenomates group bacterium Gr01-1014_16]
MEQLPYFNKITLGVILGKEGENLNYWVKRLLKKGEIVALKKGLYVSRLYLLSLAKNPGLKEQYLEYLANIIRYPSYISLEYALSKFGVIPEGVYAITSVTTKTGRTYKNKLSNFIYKNIKDNLFDGFEVRNFEDKRIKFATKAKALFDLLYFRKPGRLEDLRINWDLFEENDRQEFKKIVFESGSYKIKKELKKLKW